MSDGEGVAAALALVGVPFRLHGRDPATGLDCVGVVAHVLAAAGWRGCVPTGYSLRGGDPAVVSRLLDAILPRGDGGAGDVALVRPGPGQLHLLVLVGAGFVHADAHLRRVTLRPGPSPWPVLGAWRPERTSSWRP